MNVQYNSEKMGFLADVELRYVEARMERMKAEYEAFQAKAARRMAPDQPMFALAMAMNRWNGVVGAA